MAAGREISYSLWGESEDDDITKIPQYYEAKVTDDNRVYFIKYAYKLPLKHASYVHNQMSTVCFSHRKEETQWESPVTGLRYKVMYGKLKCITCMFT